MRHDEQVILAVDSPEGEEMPLPLGIEHKILGYTTELSSVAARFIENKVSP